MPPKIKITKEMIIDAAFEIVRTEGADNINVRNIAKKLECSTQPIMYQFNTVDEIKKEVYQKTDAVHTRYITDVQGFFNNPMLEIGMLYIRFGVEESHLFRFLFQSNQFAHKNFKEIFYSEELTPMMEILAQSTGVDLESARYIFTVIFLPVHGFASMLANNSMTYDEDFILKVLTDTFSFAVQAVKKKADIPTGHITMEEV